MKTGIMYKILKLLNFPIRKRGSNNKYTVCIFTGVNLTDHKYWDLNRNKIGKFYEWLYKLD